MPRSRFPCRSGRSGRSVRRSTGCTIGLRSRTFWFLSATFFVCGLSTNGLIGTHLIPAAIDHNLSAVTGASLLALMGLFDVIGTTCSGWLTDRVDPRHLLAWYYSLRGLAVIALPVAFGAGWALILFAVFYGLDWVATVPPTVALTADTFGRERVGIVFGWIFASHQLGAAFAAWAAGASRQWTGTYNYAFVSAGVLCLLAAGLSLRIGRFERVRGPRPRAAPRLKRRRSNRPKRPRARRVTTVKRSDPITRAKWLNQATPFRDLWMNLWTVQVLRAVRSRLSGQFSAREGAFRTLEISPLHLRPRPCPEETGLRKRTARYAIVM